MLDHYSDTPTTVIQGQIDRSKSAIHRKAMRLGLEKDKKTSILQGIQSIPEYDSLDPSFGNFLAGFVAGEGSFVHRKDGDQERFSFSIVMSDRDSEILYEIRDRLGVGNIYEHESRKDEWDAETQYVVQSIPELLKVVVPLFDEFGFRMTYKADQYSRWRKSLLNYVDIDSIEEIETFL